jgi:hypothetical protein
MTCHKEQNSASNNKRLAIRNKDQTAWNLKPKAKKEKATCNKSYKDQAIRNKDQISRAKLRSDLQGKTKIRPPGQN